MRYYSRLIKLHFRKFLTAFENKYFNRKTISGQHDNCIPYTWDMIKIANWIQNPYSGACGLHNLRLQVLSEVNGSAVIQESDNEYSGKWLDNAYFVQARNCPI